MADTRDEDAERQPPPVQVVVNVGQRTPGVLRRSWGVALLLAVTMGWLGADCFYLGQPGKGLLKLFTFGLFGVLWFVDVVMILTRSVRNVEWA